MKNICAVLALLVAAPLIAVAATPESTPIATLDAALIATMKAGSANASFQSRYAALDPIVKQTFNLPVILQNSVGFLWSTVPAAQQQQLAVLFEQFTVASYVNGFGGYGGQQIQILPEERPLGDKKIVESQIVPSDGSAPVRLDYVMAEGAAGWQITDVLLNGTISKVAVQLSDFSSLVNEGDANQNFGPLRRRAYKLIGPCSCLADSHSCSDRCGAAACRHHSGGAVCAAAGAAPDRHTAGLDSETLMRR
jgi:phospholipid transport system substrate-binding protein